MKFFNDYKKIILIFIFLFAIMFFLPENVESANVGDNCCVDGHCGGCCYCSGADCIPPSPPIPPGWMPTIGTCAANHASCGTKTCSHLYWGWDGLTCYRCANKARSCLNSCTCSDPACLPCISGLSSGITCNCLEARFGCSGDVEPYCFNCPPKITAYSPSDGSTGYEYNFTISVTVSDADNDNIALFYEVIIPSKYSSIEYSSSGAALITDTENGATWEKTFSISKDEIFHYECQNVAVEITIYDIPTKPILGTDSESFSFRLNCFPEINPNPEYGAGNVPVFSNIIAEIRDRDAALITGGGWSSPLWPGKIYKPIWQAKPEDLKDTLFYWTDSPELTSLFQEFIGSLDQNRDGVLDSYEKFCYKIPYKWQVDVTDPIMRKYGLDYSALVINSDLSEEFFKFTTEENKVPFASLVYPPNAEQFISTHPILKVEVDDPNKDRLNVSFYLKEGDCSGTFESVGDMRYVQSNSIIPMLVSSLKEATSYCWYVEVIDTHCEYCIREFEGTVHEVDQSCQKFISPKWTFTTRNNTGLLEEVLKNDYGVYSHTHNYAALHEKYWFTFNASESFDPEGSILNYSWKFGDGSVCYTNESAVNNCTCNTVLIEIDLNEQVPGCIDEWPEVDRNLDGVFDYKDCTYAAVYSGCMDLTGDGQITEEDWILGNYEDIYGDRDMPWELQLTSIGGDRRFGENLCPGASETEFRTEYACSLINSSYPNCDCFYFPEKNCRFIVDKVFYTNGTVEIIGDRCSVIKYKYSQNRIKTYIINLTVTDEKGASSTLMNDLSILALLCDEDGTNLESCCHPLPGYNPLGNYLEKNHPCEAELNDHCRYVYMTRQHDKCSTEDCMNIAYGCVPEYVASEIEKIDKHDAKFACGNISIIDDINKGLCTQFRSGCGPYGCNLFGMDDCSYNWECRYAVENEDIIHSGCLGASPTAEEFDNLPFHSAEEALACCIENNADPCLDKLYICPRYYASTNIEFQYISTSCYNEAACNCSKYIKNELGLPGGDSNVELNNWSGCNLWIYRNTSFIGPYHPENPPRCFNDMNANYLSEEECIAESPYHDDCECDQLPYIAVFSSEECIIQQIINSVYTEVGCYFHEKVHTSHFDWLGAVLWIVNPIVKFVYDLITNEEFREIVSSTIGDIVKGITSIAPCTIRCVIEVEEDSSSPGTYILQDCGGTAGYSAKTTEIIYGLIVQSYTHGCTVNNKEFDHEFLPYLTMFAILNDTCISPDVIKQCRTGNEDLNCGFNLERCTCQDINNPLARCINGSSGEEVITDNITINLNEVECVATRTNEDGIIEDIIFSPNDNVCNPGDEHMDGWGRKYIVTMNPYVPIDIPESEWPEDLEECQFIRFGYNYSYSDYETECNCWVGKPLFQETFPKDGEECSAIKIRRGLFRCSEPTIVEGRWDQSQNKCVTCDRNIEVFTLFDKDGVYPETQKYTEGYNKCEYGCGAHPYCDETEPLSYPNEVMCIENFLAKCDAECQLAPTSICYSNKYDEDGNLEPNPDITSSCYNDISAECINRAPGSPCCMDWETDDICREPGICSHSCECEGYGQYYNFRLSPGVSLISYPLLEGETSEWIGSSPMLCQKVETLRNIEIGEGSSRINLESGIIAECDKSDSPLIFLVPDKSFLLDIGGHQHTGFTLWGRVPEGDRNIILYPGWNWFGYTSFVATEVSNIFDEDIYPFIYTASPECDKDFLEVLT